MYNAIGVTDVNTIQVGTEAKAMQCAWQTMRHEHDTI